MERVGRALTLLVVAVCTGVLAGWYLGVTALTTVLPGYVSMKPNTALALIVTAVGVLLLRRPAGAVCGAAAGLLGGLTLVQYATGRSLGIDLLLPAIDLGGQAPRMSGAAAAALLLLGATLLAAPGGRARVMRGAALAAFGVGYVAVLGYAYGVSSLYSLGGDSSMAVHTAACVCALSLAVLLLDPREGLVGLLRDRGSAGGLLRPILPFVVLGPALLGAVRLWAQRRGWVDTASGVALLVVSMTMLGSVLTWRAAARLRELDAERDRAEDALEESNRGLERAVISRTTELNRAAERLSTLVRLAPVGIVELDAEGAFLTGNEQWTALSGLDPERARGYGWARSVHPEDVGRVTAEWAAAVAQGGAYETTMRFVTPRGDVNWVHARAAPVNEGGPVTGYLATVTDITMLRVAQERWRRLLEAAPDAMVAVDEHGVIRLVNGQAERLFGYPREELLGEPVETLVPEGARAAHPPSRHIYLRNPVPRPMGAGSDLFGRRKDGTEFPAEISLSALDTEDGLLVTAAVRDVTERRAFELVVSEARDTAERAARSRQEFLSTMSHEIRTPMNAVIGMTSLLLDTELAQDQREMVEIVRTSGDHLLTIINDILDYSKIDAGKLYLEELPFVLRDWLYESLELIALSARDKGLEVAADVAEDVPTVVVGDPGRLRQVLVNLLSNAVKFTAAGEVVVLVSTEPRPGPGALLRIEVRDTGVGIAPDRAESVFDPFTQADSSTTRLYGGTGLGLAISRRLVEQMGGAIRLDSKPGQGSIVSFTVQVGLGTAPDRVHDPEAFVGKRVLVVDDNATNRTILTSWVTRRGMVPLPVQSAAEALALVESGDVPSLALIDLMMPGTDGAELGALLRTALPDCRLVLLSSAGVPAHELVVKGTFDAALSKPVNQDSLFSVVAQLLEPGQGPQQPKPSLASPFAREGPHRARSVLVVEDTPVNQKVAVQLLARFGFRADVAASGIEALDALERRDYDLVLMDVQMPEMDGLEASRLIRSRWPERKVRIVAMTANVAPEDVRRCLDAGMDAFLGKPVVVAELARVLDETESDPPGPASEPGIA